MSKSRRVFLTVLFEIDRYGNLKYSVPVLTFLEVATVIVVLLSTVAARDGSVFAFFK